jgi:CRISPR-associated endonuclease/helicase Cas3
MEFYSHTDPNKKLIEHLSEVASYSLRYGDERFSKTHKIIGYAHDFGKYTTFFQEDRLFKVAIWGEKANHAYLSAIFGAYLCQKDNELTKTMFPLLVFSCILSHHGDIKNFTSSDYLPYISRNSIKYKETADKLKTIDLQKEDMLKNVDYITAEFKQIGLDKEVNEFLTTTEIVKDIINYLNKKVMEYEDEPDENQYWIHQILYSALISADKMSAARVTPVDEKYISFDALNNQKNSIISDNKPCKLDSFRNEIFSSVIDSIQKKYQTDSVFTITAPTGTGKTYTGFFCAKKLQEVLGGNKKIIYALPFTAIIDQNYQKIEELHKMNEDFSVNKSNYIIIHHHLSNKEYINSKEDYRKDQAELFIENWDSGIIVTTFVQLLQTLVGNRNRMLKKYHVITKSIVILDEIQAIPIEYYELVNFAIKKMVELFNCKVILMTATKPLIFSNSTELLDNSEYYFSKMHRTTLIPKLEKISIQRFCDIFKENQDCNKSYLIVCNTIAQSLKVYNILSENGTRSEYKYLSTNLLPLHRRELLTEIEDSLHKEKIVLISTQVVEAGVDLDFDEVIRDIGPLDSIIQCSGRCNRRWDRENGKVFVVNMVNEIGHSYASRVYGSVIIKITRDLLLDKSEIEEQEFGSLIQDYYKLILSGKVSMQESKDLIEAIKNLDFNEEHGIGTFSLIKENPNYVNLYIEYDEYASSLIQELAKAIHIENPNERRAKTKEIKREMLKYTISIPQKFAKRYQVVTIGNNDILVIHEDDVERYYCKETGLKRDEDFEMFCY